MTVGQDGQLHKVICKRCKQVLQDGINPPVEKLCMDCIRKSYPAAPGGLRDANGKRLGEDKPKEKVCKVRREMVNYQPKGQKYPTVMVVFYLEDFFNRKFEFGLTFEQIEDIYEVMNKMNTENHRIIDEK